jgi:hypothetical protein
MESFARCGFFVVARQKISKKRSLHVVNEHFEMVFNAATTEKMLRAKLSNGINPVLICYLLIEDRF